MRANKETTDKQYNKVATDKLVTLINGSFSWDDAEALLKKKADPNVKNNRGFSLLDILLENVSFIPQNKNSISILIKNYDVILRDDDIEFQKMTGSASPSFILASEAIEDKKWLALQQDRNNFLNNLIILLSISQEPPFKLLPPEIIINIGLFCGLDSCEKTTSQGLALAQAILANKDLILPIRKSHHGIRVLEHAKSKNKELVKFVSQNYSKYEKIRRFSYFSLWKENALTPLNSSVAILDSNTKLTLKGEDFVEKFHENIIAIFKNQIQKYTYAQDKNMLLNESSIIQALEKRLRKYKDIISEVDVCVTELKKEGVKNFIKLFSQEKVIAHVCDRVIIEWMFNKNYKSEKSLGWFIGFLSKLHCHKLFNPAVGIFSLNKSANNFVILELRNKLKTALTDYETQCAKTIRFTPRSTKG